MRAFEFLNETATAGATAAGGVASVAMPMTGSGFKPDGVYNKDSKPEVIRRTYPYAENNNKKKKKSKKGKK